MEDDIQKNKEIAWYLRVTGQKKPAEKKEKDALVNEIMQLKPQERKFLAINTEQIPLYPCYPFENEFDINVMEEATLKNVSIFTSKKYNKICPSVYENINLEGLLKEDLKNNIIPELLVLWKNPRDKKTPEILARFLITFIETKKGKKCCILSGSLTRKASNKTKSKNGSLVSLIKNSATSIGCKTIYNLTVCDETKPWWKLRGYGEEGKIKRFI